MRRTIMEPNDKGFLNNEGISDPYPLQTEHSVISLFLEGCSADAISILTDVIEETIGDLFRPYELLNLRFRFAATLVKILKELHFFESGMCANLPTLDFEIYKKSAQLLKSDLLQPFSVLEEEPLKSVIEQNKLIYKIRNYVSANIASDISLSELSEHIGLSASYASRFFSKTAGINFKAYVNQSKVEAAKRLLKGGLSIADVMKETGFLSRTTFNRIFRQYAGVSPGQYLQQNSEKGEKQ